MENVIEFNPKPVAPTKCSFCGKSRDKVKTLIGEGTGPHICNICLAKCTKLLGEVP